MAETVRPASIYRFATSKTTCLVAVGDSITCGQQLCAKGVFSSINGMVTVLKKQPGLNPGFVDELTIEIEPGLNQKNSFLQQLHSPVQDQQIIERIQALNITGMGGGGFPTYLKLLDAKKNNVHTLVINTLECEPGVNVDTELLNIYAVKIYSGAGFAAQAAGITEILLATKEATKPDINPIVNSMIEHRTVAGKYPQGEERRLLQALFNVKISAQQSPTEQGYLVLNTATCYAIHQAVICGEPILQRLVSINGVSRWVKIGHPVGDLTNNPACGGQLTAWPAAASAGIKATTYAVSNKPCNTQTGCIRCGRCRDVCPEPLLVDELVWQIKAQNWPLLSSLQLATCIECGACDQVCPSNIPLLANLRYGKSQLASLKTKSLEAIRATERVNTRDLRLERENRNRELRRSQRLNST